MMFVEFAEDVDGADVLARRGESEDKTTRATEFLNEALADHEWHDSAGLKKLAGAAGISERTLQRAAQSLNVESERREFPSSTWWRIPPCATALPVAPSLVAPRQAPRVGATDETAISSDSEPLSGRVAPVAPAASGNPLPGDDDFLDWIASVHRDGWITTGEALERERTHRLVLARREEEF
jgi:hypothetical protein